MSLFARLLCVLSLLCSVDAMAAPPPEAPAWYVVQKAKHRRTTGIVLTSTGAFLATTGVGLIAFGGSWWGCNSPVDDVPCNTGAIFPGAMAGLASVPLLGAGIPLWVTGNHRLHAPSVGLYHAGDATRVVLAGRW